MVLFLLVCRENKRKWRRPFVCFGEYKRERERGLGFEKKKKMCAGVSMLPEKTFIVADSVARREAGICHRQSPDLTTVVCLPPSPQLEEKAGVEAAVGSHRP